MEGHMDSHPFGGKQLLEERERLEKHLRRRYPQAGAVDVDRAIDKAEDKAMIKVMRGGSANYGFKKVVARNELKKILSQGGLVIGEPFEDKLACNPFDELPRSCLTNLPEDQRKTIDLVQYGEPAWLAERLSAAIQTRLDAVLLCDSAKTIGGLTYSEVGTLLHTNIVKEQTRISRAKAAFDRATKKVCARILFDSEVLGILGQTLPSGIWGIAQEEIDDEEVLKTFGFHLFGGLIDASLRRDAHWAETLGHVLATRSEIGPPPYSRTMAIFGGSANVLVNGILIGTQVYGTADNNLLELGRRVRHTVVNAVRGAYGIMGVDPDDWNDKKIMSHPCLDGLVKTSSFRIRTTTRAR
jgi:hypothetical protein